jgi:hypothetical protein
MKVVVGTCIGPVHVDGDVVLNESVLAEISGDGNLTSLKDARSFSAVGCSEELLFVELIRFLPLASFSFKFG